VPDAPSNVSAARGDSSASVSWTTPVTDGGSAITGYTVTVSSGGTVACSSSPCTVAGLTNGTAYTFTVHATNVMGDSVESAPSGAVTPAAVPDPPTNISAVAGSGSASVSFIAPVNSGGSPITGYTVTVSPGSSTVPCSASPCAVTGLTNGTVYTFSVHATNAIGDSLETASVSVTPATVSDPPTGVAASALDSAATVSWATPVSDGGSSITGYTVTVSPGGVAVPCSGSPCTVTGLANGTAYTFTVHATNAVGDSPESAATAPVTPTRISPPASTTTSAAPIAVQTPGRLAVQRGNGSANLSFDASSANGVTGYEVSLDGGSTWRPLATSGAMHLTATLTGLTNGVTYNVEVRSVSGTGPGGSGNSVAVVPAGVPGAPTNVTVVYGSRSAVVTFTVAASNGSAVLAYTVMVSPGGLTISCVGSPCLVTGLANGRSYTFRAYATNAVGAGAVSVSATTTSNGAGSSAGTSGAQPRGGPSGVLPFTGAPLLSLLEGGALALIVGAVLYVLSAYKRRRV
jgi:hypothetical protein